MAAMLEPVLQFASNVSSSALANAAAGEPVFPSQAMAPEILYPGADFNSLSSLEKVRPASVTGESRS